MTRFTTSARLMGAGMIWAVLALAAPAAPLQAQEPAVQRAVVTIPNPRSANLLQLRGLGGRGTARIQIGEDCHLLPVRFVAGDFSGEQIRLDRHAPIVLELRDPQLVAALLNGADIVSDETDVTSDPANPAGIFIVSGLGQGTGFVINPGRNISADLFGARPSKARCAD